MKRFRKATAMLLCMLIAFSACLTASADNAAIINDSTTRSLTVYVYQSKEGKTATDTLEAGTGETQTIPSGYVPLEGVIFNVTKDGNAYTTSTITTNASGEATLSDLPRGTYVLSVADNGYPANCTGEIAPITVKLPMTNADGNGFIYDVKVYPKVDTFYGDVTFTKYDTDGVTKLGGAKFKLQKYDETTDEYTDYTHNSVSVWATSNDASDLGTFTITGLPMGKYQLVETVPPAGYQKDTNPVKFTLDRKATYSGETYKLTTSMQNTKVGGGSKTVDEKNVAVGDYVTYTINVPTSYDFASATTFKVTDTLDAVFDVDNTTVTVKKDDTNLTASDYTVEKSDQTVTVNFSNPAGLVGATSLQISIKTKVKSMTPGLLEGIENTATVTFNDTTIDITTDDGNKVKTGSTMFKKTKTDGTNGLAGAEFKVYSDPDCNTPVSFYASADAASTVSVITTTNTGEFTIYGLDPDETYYLLETEAPTGYQLNGTAIQFQPTAGVDNTLNAEHIIVNEAKVALPFTGGVGAEVVVASGVVMMVAAGFVLKKRVK